MVRKSHGITRRAGNLVAGLFWVFSKTLLSQSSSQAGLLPEVQSAVDSIASHSTLASWKPSHGREHIDLAHYDTAKDSYEVDSPNQWCVTSVADVPGGLTRAASFYVPEVRQGSLPPLPGKQDLALTLSCRLGAVWLESKGHDITAAVTKELTAAWGAPGTLTPRERAQSLHLPGSGLWKNVSRWRRGIVTVWIGWTDWEKGNGAGPRTLIWIVRDQPRDFDLFTPGFDTASPAAKIANLSEALTADMRPGQNCSALGAETGIGRLSRWLTASKSLPAARRAAALLVADSFVRCAQESGAAQNSLMALGVKFAPGCPQDGPDYAGNFRQQAEALDPHGPAGALAALASLQTPCSLQGSTPWPDRVIDRGKAFLSRFPPGPSIPWAYFAMARAHDVKLSFSFSPGEADIGVVHHLTAAQKQKQRNAAIAAFALFVDRQPGAPDAVFAWQEAWRLMAGLLPSPTHFGCSCE